MKTIIISLAFLLTATICFGQTEELELQNLSRMFEEGEFDQEGYRDRAKAWNALMEVYGGYPSLPYDENQRRIVFIEYIDVSALNKQVIFNRIFEWAAINFGSLDAVLHYKDYESGKIILKGSFKISHKTTYKNFWGRVKESVTTKTSLQTYVFTIKDNKLKLEITQLRYEYKMYGYYTGQYYRPTDTYEMSIHDFYPITDFKPEDWKENLDLIYQTNLRIKLLVFGVELYINEYEQDYKF